MRSFTASMRTRLAKPSRGASAREADSESSYRAADLAWCSVERAFGTMRSMENDELASYLNVLARDECCRVDCVLKTSDYEVTELVSFPLENGATLGPFVRKRIRMGAHMGAAYRELFAAQRSGRRFRHLPVINDVHERDDELIVIMEHVRGRTLHDEVYERDPSLALACELFPPLCDGVIELHEDFGAPLIHRDLKPTNVIVNGSSLTIIDFGITRPFRAEAVADTAPFATRAYAPPEQFGYGQTDVRSDVYALGMVLYFLLTERNPTAEVARRGFDDPEVPPALRPVLARATAFDPQGRYQSVRALKGAFTEAVAASVAQGAPVPQGAPAPAGMPVAAPFSPEAAAAGMASAPATGVAPGAPTMPAMAPGVGAPRPATSSFGTGVPPVAPVAATAAGAVTAPPLVPASAKPPLKVSEVLGAVWDGVLLLVWLMVVGVCLMLPFNPTPDLQKYPFIVCLLMYVGMAITMTGMVYGVMDKRILRRFIPFMRTQTFGKGLIVGTALFLGGFVIMVAVIGGYTIGTL